MMIEEEIQEAIRQAYLDGFREGFHLGLKKSLSEDNGEPIEEIKNAELYAKTFFVKQTLSEGKKFFRR